MRSAKVWSDEMTPMLVLENMVENKLIIQKARELNIRIDERRISNAVESQIAQVRSQFKTEDDFFRELRNAGLLLSDLRKYYEETFTEQFLRDRLIQTEIRSKINITDSDILSFYQAQRDSIPLKGETYELAMIVRSPGPSPETNRLALEKINSLKNRLQAGEDFVTLAKEHSDCPSAKVMGDLGYFSKGMMVKEFEDAAFDLNLNQVSDVVKTSFGYHLIKLTDRKNNEIRASHILVILSESEDDVLREREFMQQLQARLQAGEDFATLAAEYSQDPDSQKNNGVIGALTRDEFPNFFEEELKDLQVGSISDVLEYQNMFYLFTINQEFESRPADFDEISDRLKEILITRRQMELYGQWMKNLKDEIFVQVYEDRLQ
jgi:peptidyl-prolyl cis-trans isomerase SurA